MPVCHAVREVWALVCCGNFPLNFSTRAGLLTALEVEEQLRLKPHASCSTWVFFIL